MIVGPSLVLSVERARRLHPELLRLVHREGVLGAPDALALVDELGALLRAVDAADGHRPVILTADERIVDSETAAAVLGLARRTVTGRCLSGRLRATKENGRWRVALPQ